MSDNSSIEWTDATWNPVSGCTKVSAGCDHCYAETFAERFRGTPGHYFERGFDVQLRPDKLDWPLRKRKPQRIFVNSMSDLFHDKVPDDYIARVWAVMELAEQHTFQVLTKRHARMRSLLSSVPFGSMVSHAVRQMLDDGVPFPDSWDPEGHRPEWPLPNVWLGVSTENQYWADRRIPALLDTPAAVRFISAEPLLGPIDVLGDAENPGPAIVRTGVQTQPHTEHGPAEYDYDDQVGIDWVIVGGESGPGARPMHPDWVRSLRDQCTAASVPFLFKQWGAHRIAIPGQDTWDRIETIPLLIDVPMEPGVDVGPWAHMRRVGKKAAGRELDGRTWDQYPAAAHV